MEISVIVPMYNSESTIKACVESILQQQGVAEILLCDDGSTDNTAQLCQHLATLYPCIQYLSCPHQGPSAARNIGLQKVSLFLSLIQMIRLINTCMKKCRNNFTRT